MTPPDSSAPVRATHARDLFRGLKASIQDVFVGQDELVEFVLYALFAEGHVLIEGVPGLGKTLLVRTLASTLDVPMGRIQFTPDLMPADITGTTVLAEKEGGGHELRFQPGPIVASIILADEINRATPKTQSALLEAMQERQVSVGGRTLALPEPFMVLATQNPLEQEGTYPLPEAQLDRFLVKLLVGYPKESEYAGILDRTTKATIAKTGATFAAQDVLDARAAVRDVIVSSQVSTYAVRIVMATQPHSPYAPSEINRLVACGAGPRAAQALLMLAKARAIVDGRFSASCDDVRAVAPAVLRHRLILNFTGLAERVSGDALAAAAVDGVAELTAP